MIICPWCGTNYLTFQPNCQNCGGPLPAEDAVPGEASGSNGEPPQPPAAPRPISNRYAWRLLAEDGWGIAAFIFGLLGAIFTLIGAALTMGIVTAFVGIPFLLLGLVLLAAGGGMFWRSFPIAQKTVRVLRDGEPAKGQITNLQQNTLVTVNGRSPWLIDYEYHVDGQTYAGNVTTLNVPGPGMQVGKPVRVLYLPAEPKWSSIYPHP